MSVALMGNHAIIAGLHTRFQRSINGFKVIKTEQSIYECLLGFCFNNNIFCAATNFGCIDKPNSRNEEMMVMVSLLLRRFVLNSKLSVEHILYCYSQRSSEQHFFHGALFPMLLKFAESRVEN